MKSKKALSPVVASILLMVLAIAGSIMVYRFFMSTSNVLTTNFSYQVLEGRLITLSNGGAAFYMVIKNVGSEAFTIDTVEVTSDGQIWVQVNSTGLPTRVDPGEVITLDGMIQPGTLIFTSGREYIVKITVTTVSGETRIIQEVLRAS